MNAFKLKATQVNYFLIFAATACVLIGCDSNGSNKTADASSAVDSKQATVHPLIKLRTVEFGPFRKSRTAWEVSPGRHELRLVIEPADQQKMKEAETLINGITGTGSLKIKGKQIPFFLKPGKRGAKSLEITSDVLVPGSNENNVIAELFIGAATANGEETLFAKKFKIVTAPPKP